MSIDKDIILRLAAKLGETGYIEYALQDRDVSVYDNGHINDYINYFITNKRKMGEHSVPVLCEMLTRVKWISLKDLKSIKDRLPEILEIPSKEASYSQALVKYLISKRKQKGDK